MTAMRIIVFLFASLLATIEGGGSALAHASLLRSTPAEGDVLAHAPQNFVLTFNEPVSPIVVRLINPDGTGNDLSDVRAHDESVVIGAPSLKTGTHALSWRMISADGHPVGGSIVFSIGTLSASSVAVQTSTPPVLMAAIWLARVVLYLGLFVGVGGRFFAAWIAPAQPLPRSAERTIDGYLLAGLVGAVASLGLQGLDALGVNFERLADWSVWATALNTSYALTLAMAAFALVLALASSRVGSVLVRRGTTAFAILVVSVALAVSGHAGDAPPQTLTRPAIFIHGVCIALWVGSLLPLAALAREGGALAADSLTRFSRIIPIPVVLLVASGALLATVQVSHIAALWTTAYGWVFDAKITAVVVLLGVAAWNRFRLTPGVQAGDSGSHRKIVRSIAVETVLVTLILGLVATWRFTPPPRASALVVSQAEPIHFHVHGARAMADVSFTPGQVGSVSVSIAIQSGDLGPLDAKGVTLTLSNPTAGIEPTKREARHLNGVIWRIDDFTIPAAGTWTGKVDILITDFDQITLQEQFNVPR